MSQGFNEEIEKSKKNFTNARKFIPIIKQLIKSANASANTGKSFVDMGLSVAMKSKKIVDEASTDITDIKKVCRHLFVCSIGLNLSHSLKR